MFIVIISSNNWNDYESLKRTCNHLLSRKVEKEEEIWIIGGTEDELCKKYASESGFKYQNYSINWTKYGKRAGLIRSRKMCEIGNAAIIFYSAYSENKGEKILADIARSEHLLVREIKEPEDEE